MRTQHIPLVILSNSVPDVLPLFECRRVNPGLGVESFDLPPDAQWLEYHPFQACVYGNPMIASLVTPAAQLAVFLMQN